MRQDIQRHFTALGLSPGASANDIRVAYRKLIQQWHPDRFAVGSLMQTTAEDHTKELNEAYEWLYKKRHYRKYLSPAAKGRPVARPAAGVAAEPEAKAPEAPRPAPRASRRPAVLRSRRWWKITALVVGLGATACLVGFLLQSQGTAPRGPWAAAPLPAATPDTPSGSTASPPTAAAEPSAAAPLGGDEPVRKRAERSEGEGVALNALQRRPRTDVKGVGGNPLHPLARAGGVLASSGVAIGASSSRSTEAAPASPLSGAPAVSGPANSRNEDQPGPPSEIFRQTAGRAGKEFSGAEWDRRLDASEAELDTFEMGDSLERVKVVQGRPDETTTGAFRYGSSLVFFEKGKVSGWINGLPRLRIPRLSFADWRDEIDAVTLGSSRGEVFKIQGRPDEVFADAYYYGTDAVFFSGDRVVNWIQTDDRLRTRLLPDLPFSNLPSPP